MNHIPGRRSLTPALSCESVTVRFGGVVALSDVSLAVPRSGIVGLMGPNGAGKSTLFDVLSGLRRPNAGTVAIDGRDVTGLTPQSANPTRSVPDLPAS